MGVICVESGIVERKSSEARVVAPTKDRPRRLLVADDEHLVASGLAASLKELGFEVVGPVSDGRAALKLCREERPDLALLDIRMPELDGPDAAQAIFEQCLVPVIIFSAYSDPEEVKRCDGAGIFGYLLKPVTQDQLRVGISIAWGRFRDYMEVYSETTKLRQRLEDRKLIEQAKWILVKRKEVDEPEAMRLLQRQARNTRRPLVEIAKGIIDNDSLINGE